MFIFFGERSDAANLRQKLWATEGGAGRGMVHVKILATGDSEASGSDAAAEFNLGDTQWRFGAIEERASAC
jgi:hypothetical protein